MNDLILTFSIEEGTMEMNKGVIEALGTPRQVQIRIDKDACQLMLRACSLTEDQAVVVQNDDVPQVGGRRLMKKIGELAGWKDQERRYVYGVAVPEYNAVVFNLLDSHLVSEL